MHIIRSFENDVIRKKKMVAEDKAIVVIVCSLCPCTACTCARILSSVAPPRSSGRAPCFKQHLEAALGCYVRSKPEATKRSRDPTT